MPPDIENPSLLEKVERLKIVLTWRALAKARDGDDDEYHSLRQQLTTESSIAATLPDFLRVCSDLDEFRRFIQANLRPYNEREDFIREQLEPLIRRLQVVSTPAVATSETPEPSEQIDKRAMVTADTSNKRKTVFVVYGRNSEARRELFAFLRALGLRPLEWNQAVVLLGAGTPHPLEVVNKGLETAQAFLVFLTPDDAAYLLKPYHGDDEESHEKEPTGQPRQNVLFEAGMAMALARKRTIIVTFGKLRPISDIAGLHFIRMNGSRERRHELATRLESAGCDVDTTGDDWIHAGNFDEALMGINTALATVDRNAPANPIIPDNTKSSLDVPDLSDEERLFLIEMSRPRNIDAYPIDDLDGVVADEVDCIETMMRFEDLGLVWMGRNVYSLTIKGRKIADQLLQSRILLALFERGGYVPSPKHLFPGVTRYDDDDLKELDRHIQSLNDAGKMTVTKGSIQITELGLAAVTESG